MTAPYKNSNRSFSHSGYHPEVSNRFPVFAPELATKNDGFDKALFEILFEIEPTHFWFRSRNNLLIRCFKRYFPSTRNYCEIGCGTGYVLKAISSENLKIDMSVLKFIYPLFKMSLNFALTPV